MSEFSHHAPSAVGACLANSALCEEMQHQLAEMLRADTYAPLASDVYKANSDRDSDPPDGWSRKSRSHDEMRELLGRTDISDDDIDDLFEPEGLNYRAMLYENDKTKELVLAFRGTEFTSLEDWGQNARQGAGLESAYYERAKRLARDLDVAAMENGRELTITGHSLGGGMASAAAIVSGRDAVTFNAAGVHPNTVEDYDIEASRDRISAYVVDGEVLNHIAQDNRQSIRGAVIGGAGYVGNAVAGPAGGVVAAGGAARITRDAIPLNSGSRIPLPDATENPKRAWYNPRRLLDGLYDLTGIEQHGMDAVEAGITEKRNALESRMAQAGC